MPVSAPIPFGPYELLERIAEGGMAEVWRARSRGVAGFEKTVVIKRVLPTLLERPGFAELLVREAKIASRLSHPNIIQIFDLGEEEGGYFIAMEYLRGRDLAAALSYRAAGEPPLGLALRLWIGAEVAKALDYAHRAQGDDGKPLQIVHRDVSPQNVLLGYEGEVKVADFGIARADEPGLGRGEDPKILRGKYAYMSPEQARGERLDRRSDLFSFGVLLYELATRRRMFRGRSSDETLRLVRRGELPDFRKHLPLPELEPILKRALEVNAADRFASAGEIHQALMRLVYGLGEPVGATDLRLAMQRMFPQNDRQSPNKLRVDLLVRAYDDATSASGVGTREGTARTEAATAKTAALPGSQRVHAETRRLAFLAVRARPGEERLFVEAVEETGGTPIPRGGAMRLAAYGAHGMERAVGHATRGALELRRTTRLEGIARVEPSPAAVVLAGEARVVEGVPVEPDEALLERASAMLAGTEPGDIRVSAELAAELGRDFRFHAHEDALRIDGFRSRRDRDAVALRRRAPLIGRRDVLRALSARLLSASEGRGEVVHVVGEPGVGKSRLLAELRAAAAPRDFVFVHGRADEADAEGSFGAFADLVRDLCGIEPEDAPAQRFEKVERLRVLGLSPREVRLLGELVGLAYPLPSEARSGRPRGIELALALRKALRALSADRVVVLALEDLHWMDDASRQVLPLATEGLEDARVLTLVTVRPGSTGPLPKASRVLSIPTLEVQPTGRLLAALLAVDAVEPELAARVQRETGGVPAWIEVLAEPLRALVEVEDGVARLPRAERAELPVPSSVRAVVAARLERLRPRARSMLRVAAALVDAGDESVSVRLLSAVEGLVGHTERAPLRRLLLRRLLLAEGTPILPERLGAWGGDEEDERLPERVRLPSRLVCRAVLAELDEGAQERLHGRVVATLERLGATDELDTIERLARHAARAVDRRRAPDYLMRAGEMCLAQGMTGRAASHFASAADVMRAERGDPADADAYALSLRAADLALGVGDVEGAERALAPLGVASGRVEPELWVRRAMAEARRARTRFAPEEAAAALDAVSARLDSVSAPLRAEARLVWGGSLLEAGKLDAALEVLAAAAAEGGDGRASASWAEALVRADRLEDAERAVQESLARAARAGGQGPRGAALAALAALAEAKSEPAKTRWVEATEVVSEPSEAVGLRARAALAAFGEDDDVVATTQIAAARDGASAAWMPLVEALEQALAVRVDPDARYVAKIVAAIDRLEAEGRHGAAAMAVEALAFAHLALGDRGAASRTLDRASALAEAAGHRSQARRLAERARNQASGGSSAP